MNPKTAAKWVEAHEHCQKTRAPSVLSKYAEGKYKTAIRVLLDAPKKTKIRMPRGVKPKRPTLPKLKKELDRVFSLFIRRRDCAESGGWGRCATCSHPIHAVQTAQASHYQVRQDMATRWDEANVHAACGNCNGFRGGEVEKMAVYIDSVYGHGTAANLRAKARQPFKLNRQWLESKITHYKSLIGEAAKPPTPSTES